MNCCVLLFIYCTYHYQQNKVNPVPKRMSILNIIHYICPSFQTYNLNRKYMSCSIEKSYSCKSFSYKIYILTIYIVLQSSFNFYMTRNLTSTVTDRIGKNFYQILRLKQFVKGNVRAALDFDFFSGHFLFAYTQLETAANKDDAVTIRCQRGRGISLDISQHMPAPDGAATKSPTHQSPSCPREH